MPMFQIHVLNSDFDACSEIDAVGLEDARHEALRSALSIGVDEVCNGSSFFGAEVSVALDGNVSERFLVSIGQSPLR